MNTGENQRIKLTKRLLRLLAKKDIQHITVSELCDGAEINRSTLYNHYVCPVDALAEIECGIVTDLEQIWQRKSARKDWPLSKRVESLYGYLQEHRDLAKLLFRSSDSVFASAAQCRPCPCGLCEGALLCQKPGEKTAHHYVSVQRDIPDGPPAAAGGYPKALPERWEN